MKRQRATLFALIAGALIILIAGCATPKKEEVIEKAAEPAAAPVEEVKEEEPTPPPPVEEVPVEEPVKEEAPVEVAKEAAPQVEMKDELTQFAEAEGKLYAIYFDFDRFTIRDDMRPTLEKNAEWLKNNPGIKIQIQGHCDERGTNEYNIALGERRAQSIKAYLANYGIDAASLSTLSYGEERPVDSGHNEDAWSKNRRGELVIIKK